MNTTSAAGYDEGPIGRSRRELSFAADRQDGFADPVSLSNIVTSALGQGVFLGKVNLRRIYLRPGPIPQYAVAIPVRNERRYLAHCLSALAKSIGSAKSTGIAVLVVHDSDDGSCEIARNSMRELGIPGCVVGTQFDPSIRNAPHARRLALDIGSRLLTEGNLFTTDADSWVGSDWITRFSQKLAAGYDLVCEDVRLDEDELATLPQRVRDVGEVERAYFRATEALWSEWTGGTAGAFAHRASGASMALTIKTYRSLGGLPLPNAGEDLALCEAARIAGFRIASLADCGTRTSARLCGRASGGCSETLAIRSKEDDPLCDQRLVPVAVLRRLARLAGAVVDGQAAANLNLVAPWRTRSALSLSEVRKELEVAHRTLGWQNA